MIKSIQVLPNTFAEEILCEKSYQKFKRLNLLIGGNGVGKTTLIQAIANQKDVLMESNRDIRPYLYQNSRHNHRQLEANPFTDGHHFNRIAYQKMMAHEMSEGQSIIYSLLAFFNFLKEEADAYPEATIVALFDEVDSGLTPDHLNMVMHLWGELLKDHSNLQIIAACNQYHWVYCVKWALNLQTGEWMNINSYEEFCQLYFDQMTELGALREHKFLKTSKYIPSKG